MILSFTWFLSREISERYKRRQAASIHDVEGEVHWEHAMNLELKTFLFPMITSMAVLVLKLEYVPTTSN